MAYSKDEIDQLFQKIITQILEDGTALRNILKQSKMPSTETFYKWLDSDDDKSKRYARACEYRADKIFDDILTIADSTEDDIIIDEDGKLITNHNVIQRDRLRVEARKWAASKLNPKKYGDKIDVTTKGGKITDKVKVEFIDFSED